MRYVWVRGALFLLALPCAAQSLKPLRVAEAAYLAASVADVRSSWGLHELNPVLGRGQFGARQASISLGISAGTVLMADTLGRKFPKLRKPLAITLFIAGGVRGGMAVRNWRQQ